MNPQKPKPRPAASCAPCRSRKIKCDRLSPCEACTARGISTECKYATADEDRSAMAQADVIASLRARVRRLRGEVAEAEEEGEELRELGGSMKEEEMMAMEVLYAQLQGGEPGVVWGLVERVRAEEGVGAVVGGL